MTKQSPKIMALAYRIWCYAHPLGWDCTAAEIADALGVTYQQVGHVLRIKGWTSRTRSTTTDQLKWREANGLNMSKVDQDEILSRFTDD